MKTLKRILSLLILTSLIAACATTPPAAAPEAPPSEGWVEVGDGVRIYYSVLGDHGPVILVPIGRIVGDLQPVADAGFRVVLIDSRGRGLSTTVTEEIPLSLETDLSDLDAVRQAVGVDRVNLIGISYYGALVALYAAEYPAHTDKVVMLDPMAPTAEIFADRTPTDYSTHPAYIEIDRMRRDGLHESDPPAFCRAYYTAHAIELFADPSRFDAAGLTYCDLENEWPDNILTWAGKLFSSIGTWDFREQAAKIEAPALVVQGKQDQITPPKGAPVWTESMHNQARLVWMDDCGHVPLKEHPEETRKLIIEFLSD